MLDTHAHLGSLEYKNAFVATSAIISENEFSILQNFPYYAVGYLYKENEIVNYDLLYSYLERGAFLGEVGLDKRFGSKDKQLEIFRKVLNISKSLNKGAVIHNVRCHEEVYNELKKAKLPFFIIHSYSGSFEMAKRFIDIGGYISISPKSEKLKDFNSLLKLPFFTETDLPTSKEEVEILKKWNFKLSTLLDRDIEKESEFNLKVLLNG